VRLPHPSSSSLPPERRERRQRSGWSRLALVAWLFLAALGGRAADTAPIAGEYPLKAVFLANFAKFVEWPQSAFTNAAAPFVVAVAGEDPFGSGLDTAFAGQTVGGHPVVLRRYPAGEAVSPCHLLFVSRSEKERQGALLAGLQGQPVLTVGESERFLESGGMINLTIAKDRVRFEVNTKPAERAGVKLGAKLLGVAVRVLPADSAK
jgi:hypothetical protein